MFYNILSLDCLFPKRSANSLQNGSFIRKASMCWCGLSLYWGCFFWSGSIHHRNVQGGQADKLSFPFYLFLLAVYLLYFLSKAAETRMCLIFLLGIELSLMLLRQWCSLALKLHLIFPVVFVLYFNLLINLILLLLIFCDSPALQL